MRHRSPAVVALTFLVAAGLPSVSAASSPFSGAPIAVPGTWEAEDFDLGVQDDAYHDNVPGNAGGPCRPNDDVDTIVSSDLGGGCDVNNFETGEWLAYTVQVVGSGVYDIELRASNMNWTPPPAFHVEVDGVNVTGSVVVPSTGAWDVYAWVTKSGVFLSAGLHVLKIVSDQQYFNLNKIRVTAARLFSSGFESSTAVSPVAQSDCWATGCWQDLTGADSTTGYAWPPAIWGGGGRLQLLADAPVTAATIGNFMINQIQAVTGHNGTPTQTLYSEIKQQGGPSTQDPFMLLPTNEAGDLYISYWLKFQPDLLQKMTPQNWRVFFEWKTAGDYRVSANVNSWEDGCNGVKPQGPLFWDIRGDNNANGGLPLEEFWKVQNCSIAVPVGQWFKFEVFWHRSSGTDGRVWMAVNGNVIADRLGPNMGVNNAPIDRIMVNQLYSGSPYPIYQWVDDLRIWNNFPPPTDDPPYGPH